MSCHIGMLFANLQQLILQITLVLHKNYTKFYYLACQTLALDQGDQLTTDHLTKVTMVMRMTSDTRVRRVRWVRRMTRVTLVMRLTKGDRDRVMRMTGVTW